MLVSGVETLRLERRVFSSFLGYPEGYNAGSSSKVSKGDLQAAF